MKSSHMATGVFALPRNDLAVHFACDHLADLRFAWPDGRSREVCRFIRNLVPLLLQFEAEMGGKKLFCITHASLALKGRGHGNALAGMVNRAKSGS